MLFREAQDWDEWYSKRIGNLPIYKDAIRVEQGEYVVTTLENELGTYNVHQCANIYAANKTKKLHGLAHIDGHTEISSLYEFILALNPEPGELEVRILGARSSEVFLLNNRELTLDKIQLFFNQPKIQRFLATKDIGELIESRNQNLQDFVIDSDGKARRGLATGGATEHRALHAIQALRRKDGYKGTYPIIQGYNGQDKTVYLDERAICKLEEKSDDEKEGAEPSAFPKLSSNLDNEEEYKASILKIRQRRGSAIAKVLNAIGDMSQNQGVKRILSRTSLYIGLGGFEKNQQLVTVITQTQDIRVLNERLANFSLARSNASIQRAINIALRYDERLDTEDVLSCLTTKYNQKEQTEYTDEEVSQKRYGAVLDIEDFIGVLVECSSKIRNLIILHVGYLNNQECTAQEALEAATYFGEGETLQGIAKHEVDRIQSEDVALNKDDLYQAFEGTLKAVSEEQIRPIKKRALLAKFNELKNNIEDFTAFQQFIARYNLINGADIIRDTMQRYNEIRENNKQGEITHINNNYSSVQEAFLAQIKSNGTIPEFNDLTISIELARSLAANNLRRSEKKHLEEKLRLEKFNLEEEILQLNKDKIQQAIILELLSTVEHQTHSNKTSLSPKTPSFMTSQAEGSVTFIPEDDHMEEHGQNVDKLILDIKRRTIKQDTTIFLERKQYGNNLGMKDVVLLSGIITYNNTHTNKIKLPNGIERFPIYKDAMLYSVARTKGISVLGAEGKGLNNPYKLDYLREQYMAKTLYNITKQGKNVIFIVGSDHVAGIKSMLTIEKMNINNHEMVFRHDKGLLAKLEYPNKHYKMRKDISILGHTHNVLLTPEVLQSTLLIEGFLSHASIRIREINSIVINALDQKFINRNTSKATIREVKMESSMRI